MTADSTSPKLNEGGVASASTVQDASTEGTSDYASDPPAPSTLPLHCAWTLWFDNPRLAPAESTDWKDNLKSIGTFAYIPHFWRVFNNVRPASHLSVGSNYSVFRQGILPAWEDHENKAGGKFLLTLPKKDNKKGKLDEYWLFTVLALVGETMDPCNQVNGAVVSIRKSQDRIALWLKSADRDMCVAIGQRWKKVLDLEKIVLRYQTHADAAASGNSFRNESQFEV